jgi:hypothetical protein
MSRRYLEPRLPGYVTIRGLLLRHEIEWVLTGLLFESSAYRKERFDVTAIAMPLYVPAEVLVLDTGIPVRGRTGVWEIDQGTEEEVMRGLCEAALSEALPFMEAASTPSGLAEHVEREQTPTRNPRTWEKIAYSHVLADRTEAARQALSTAMAAHDAARAQSRELGLPERTGTGDRLSLIGDLLEAGRDDAVAQLARWREMTLENLGLGIEDGRVAAAS